MSISIRINEDLYNQAKIPNQIEYWAKIGKNAIANPDLPIDMIKDLLIAKNEQSEPFEFEE